MREDWIETKLEEVFEIVTGNTPSKKDDSNYGEDIPFVKPPELNNYPIIKASEFLSKKGALKGRVLPIGSVLITCIGNLGRVGINNYPVAFNQQINALKPNLFIESKFTFYQAQQSSFKNQLESLSTSTTVALVNKTNFSTIKFAIAPLPEQRTIVAKIEQLFSELDNGIANLKTAQEQLKVYRQAVLKKAFEGELTIKNEKEDEVLIAAEPDVRYGKNSLANKWQEYPFSDILILRKDKHKPEKIENKFYIGLEHIEKETGRLTDNVGFEEIKTVKNKFYKGDILYGKLRPYLNKAYLAKEDGVCSTDILVFKPTKNVLGNLMIHYFLGRKFVNDMSENTSGVNLPRVSTKYVENHKILLPNIRKQHQIVQQIESRLSVCDKVEETIVVNLQKAEALRQSILKKAFSGELLTEAEIAACKMEKDWEPAGDLLKRIKKEKTKS